MIPVWPTEIKRPLREGYEQQRGDVRRMTRPDDGPVRARRGRSKSTETIPMAFYCSPDQRARFDRFYVEETAEGAIPFLMPDWGRDELELHATDGSIVTTHDDVPILIAATWFGLFGQSVPSVTPMGIEWRISFDFVVLPS